MSLNGRRAHQPASIGLYRPLSASIGLYRPLSASISFYLRWLYQLLPAVECRALLADERGGRFPVVLGLPARRLRLRLHLEELPEPVVGDELALDLPVRDGGAVGEAPGEIEGGWQYLFAVVHQPGEQPELQRGRRVDRLGEHEQLERLGPADE